MASSIQSVLLSVGLDTGEIESGAKSIEATQRSLAKQAERSAKEQEKYQKQIVRAQNARLRAEKQLENAVKQNKSPQQLDIIRGRINELVESEHNLAIERDKASLKHKAQLDAQARLLKEQNSLVSKSKRAIAGLGNSFSGLGGMVAGALSVGAIRAFITEMADLGRRAKDFTITADGLRYLQEQAGIAGVNASELDDGLKTLKKALGDATTGTGSQADAFKRLGVDIKNADGTYRDFSEVLPDVADGFKNLGNTADKAKLAEDLLGGSGQKLIRIFNEGGAAIAAKTKELGKYDEIARQAAEADKTLANAGNAIKDTTVGGVNLLSQIGKSIGYLIEANGWIGDAIDLRKQDIYYSKEQAKIEAQRAKDAEKYAREESERIAAKQKAEAELQAARESTRSANDKAFQENVAWQSNISNILAEEEMGAEIEKFDLEQKREEEAKKRAIEEAKRIAGNRAEFDLQLKIAKLESGDARQQAQAEAIKNSLERNRLMKEYGFSIAEATARLKEQKAIEGGDKVAYSDKDIAKAKRIMERGEKGTVGKKTLEQAQAIVEGRAIDGDKVAMFAGVNPRAQRDMQFAPTTTATPSKAQSTSQQQQSTSTAEIESITTAILGKISVLDDIKTSVTQYFNERTRGAK